MNRHVFLLLAGAALVPFGCTMAPKYARPAAPVPAEWPTGAAYQAGQRSSGATAVEAQALRWQEFFTDTRLQQVIGTALTNNRDLRLAALNVERARGMYGIQRAALLPTVNANGNGGRRRVPADLSSSGQSQTSGRYDVNLGVAAWEIDFFGRIRSLKDRALQEYLGTEQARRGAQILLVASVADAYLSLAADRENLKLAETTLESQTRAYELIKRRYDLGLAPELDLFRAQTPMDAARRDVARFVEQLAQDQNALDLLVGAPVPSELLPPGLASLNPPTEIAAGISSEVLLRRPDVVQAESLLRAAFADIGAARATFFPRISLTAAIGTASSDLSGLFKSGSGAWSYTPEIVMPVFDARTWAAFRVAKVQREMAVAQYEKAIQNAFREVADALAARGTVDQQQAAQQSLVKAFAETYRLSNSRYERGLDSYLGVLDAQRSLFAAQQGLVSLRLANLTSQVRLYSVLGGGWQTEPPAGSTTVSAATEARP